MVVGSSLSLLPFAWRVTALGSCEPTVPLQIGKAAEQGTKGVGQSYGSSLSPWIINTGVQVSYSCLRIKPSLRLGEKKSGHNNSNLWLVSDSLRTAELEGANLRNDVVSEAGVFGHSVREAQGDKSDEALDFMDHCICVGHLGPVSHTRFPWSSYYLVNLFLNFLCHERHKPSNG